MDYIYLAASIYVALVITKTMLSAYSLPQAIHTYMGSSNTPSSAMFIFLSMVVVLVAVNMVGVLFLLYREKSRFFLLYDPQDVANDIASVFQTPAN